MSASTRARNGFDCTVVPLMTVLVGSEPEPAMLSKKPLMVLVTLDSI
jgi:hypothetical protein